MAKNKIDCYVIPATPLPLLLPKECIAELVEKPEIVGLEDAPANWMKGHATWNSQRISVLSYSGLHDPALDESRKRKPVLVVLNPIPDAARKAYVGILSFGKVESLSIDKSIESVAIPEKVDRRYVEDAVQVKKNKYLIPKLAALSVAYSYF